MWGSSGSRIRLPMSIMTKSLSCVLAADIIPSHCWSPLCIRPLSGRYALKCEMGESLSAVPGRHHPLKSGRICPVDCLLAFIHARRTLNPMRIFGLLTAMAITASAIAADDAGCTWPPEAVYVEEAGDYLVFWASKIGSANYSKQRI